MSRDTVLKQIVGVGFPRVLDTTTAFVPLHEYCGGVLKADVTLFGEALPTGAMAKAARSVYASSVTLVVGSSLEVAPANLIPGIVKYRPYGRLVVINLDNR